MSHRNSHCTRGCILPEQALREGWAEGKGAAAETTTVHGITDHGMRVTALESN